MEITVSPDLTKATSASVVVTASGRVEAQISCLF